MPTDAPRRSGAWPLAVVVLVVLAVSTVLGVYGRTHVPTGRAVTTLGFATLLDMKAWLTTAAAVLALAQLATALRMYGRLGHGPVPAWVPPTHRLTGVVAVVLTLPVAGHCLWSLGVGTYSTRVLVHSALGCFLYGVLVAKLLALRWRAVPDAAVPWLGGTLVATLVALWATSSLWFFGHGSPGY